MNVSDELRIKFLSWHNGTYLKSKLLGRLRQEDDLAI
jgi:hypothetical protein